MRLPIVLRRPARAEFDAAADWYDQQRPGLARDFITEVRHVLSRIRANPQLYASVHGDIREGLTRRFPYAIYYRVEPEQIVVLAIIHTSRDPAIWQNRD